jgi:hypothetical protein
MDVLLVHDLRLVVLSSSHTNFVWELLSTKICGCCGQSFQPDTRVKNHTYCSAPCCQKERRKPWRQTKMMTDTDPNRRPQTRANTGGTKKKIPTG